MSSEILQKMTFGEIRYSNVWEDADLLEKGLVVEPDDVVLSIGSAGCNSFALLLMGAAKVATVDLSPAQCALIRLKIAGIRELSHGDFVALLGLSKGRSPLEVYASISNELDEQTRRFWDERREALASGIVHCGKLDKYFKTFRDEHLIPLVGLDSLLALCHAKTMEQQHAALRKVLTPELRAKVRWYFGQDVMQEHGRDPAQFAHVTAHDIGSDFFERFTRVCTQLPTYGNCYLELLLCGQYADYDLAPTYLRPLQFERLKGLIDRLEVRQCSVEDYLRELPDQALGKANLSDIFEYMSESSAEEVFELLATKLRPLGRIAYWNLLVPRSVTTRFEHALRPLEQLSADLTWLDRAVFYSAFRVDEHV